MAKTTRQRLNRLEIKDALCEDLEQGGDLTSVVWTLARKYQPQFPQGCDWITYEDIARVIFQLHAGNTINERQTLIALSELLGAITGRGAAL